MVLYIHKGFLMPVNIMSDLMKRLKKANTVKDASLLSNSKFFKEEFFDAGIPVLNLACSGKLNGGYSKGITLFTGESKTFKTMFLLTCAKKFLQENTSGIFIFYDVEGGVKKESIENMGFDGDRFYVKRVETIEELTQDMLQTLDTIEKGDRVIFGVDSLGAINTSKSENDATTGAGKVDLTKPKLMKKFLQLVNPKLLNKNLPAIFIAQVYDSMDMYSMPIIEGGKALVYTPDTILYITKAKNGKGQDTNGSIFTLMVSKSRFIKENSKLPVIVTQDKGIQRYSGIFDIAIDVGFIERPTSRSYDIPVLGVSGFRSKLDTNENMKKLIDNVDFQKAVHKRYSLGLLEMDDDVLSELEEDN